MAGRAGKALVATLLGVGVAGALASAEPVQRGAVSAVRAAVGGADAWLAEQPLHGVATVTDGDTLRVGGVKVRLFGIDAPELSQTCGDGWRCGAAAAERLGALAAAGPVTCTPRDRDRYGRVVATCTVGGVDLADRMVAEGLARAFVRYGDDYADVEGRAKAERIGLWRGAAEAPWDYRADRALERLSGGRQEAAPEGDDGCRIKGNIGSGGKRVYHLPGSPGYARTRIDTDRGERWFCDEAAARAAGFLPPRGVEK